MVELKIARFAAGPKIRGWAREHGVSDWMAARIARLHDEPQRVLDGLLKRPPRYLRANVLRATPEEINKRLEARQFKLSRSELDDNLFRVRSAPMSIGATFEHMQGLTMPQDVASASAPLALAARPGDVVADLAAAPGVKTLHVACDLAPGPMSPRFERGAVVAVEPDPERMRALRFNLERCGVASAVLRQERAQDMPGEAWADKVLLDAPCTGEGTMPKDKNRRFAVADEIPRMAAVQHEMLDAAHRILKPGGTLVYATCTFGPEENEVQLQRLIDMGYVMQDLPFDKLGGEPLGRGVTEWPGFTLDASLAKARRFFPGIHPSLGFFVAKLKKGTQADDGSPTPAQPSLARPVATTGTARPPRRAHVHSPPVSASAAHGHVLGPASQMDETTVLSFFEALQPQLAKHALGRYVVSVLPRGGVPVASAITPEALDLPEAVRSGVASAGLALGTVEGETFHLDLQGAVLASRYTKAQSVRVTEQAAQLVLYGRNVLGTSIVWGDPDLEKGDACIVANGRGEALAIGVIVGSFKSSREAVRPVHDLGTYLRDQDDT